MANASSKRKHDENGWERIDDNDNPLLCEQQRFLNSLSPEIRSHFFSTSHISPAQRAEVWENQAELGENLVNLYSWATPDLRLLRVFQHFSPIVEVGCGSNAYWSKWMHSRGGVDVIALDADLDIGGKISVDQSQLNSKSKSEHARYGKAGNLIIRSGGPESLSEDNDLRDSGRTLFLCYPDEENYTQDKSDDEDKDECDGEDGDLRPYSMAAACLEHFTGSTIIHVGELYGDTLSFDQAPFGRSSSSEFSQRLATEYHCILKVRLQNNWLHVRDTLSVWKRSELCCMKYKDDNDVDDQSGSDDEVCYKYIPPDEVLPVDRAAPCVAHLLSYEGNNSDLCSLHEQEDTAVQRGNKRK